MYRIEGNIPQLYRLLYAYVSVVLDTMAEHADWNDQRYAERVRREKKRVEEALLELEALQPVINAEAEAWRRSTPAGRPPPVARADRAENGPDGGLGASREGGKDSVSGEEGNVDDDVDGERRGGVETLDV